MLKNQESFDMEAFYPTIQEKGRGSLEKFSCVSFRVRLYMRPVDARTFLVKWKKIDQSVKYHASPVPHLRLRAAF